MRTKKMIVAFLMMFCITSLFGQENSRKARREISKMEKLSEIDSLINSREFVFVAKRAIPQTGQSVDLTTNSNYVKFHPEKIESYMPFFGRAYSIDYGGDGGIKFEGKPDKYKVIALKKGKGYEIDLTVSLTRDSYKLSLFVSPDGSASLIINSNQRSVISYYGDILKLEKDKI